MQETDKQSLHMNLWNPSEKDLQHVVYIFSNINGEKVLLTFPKSNAFSLLSFGKIFLRCRDCFKQFCRLWIASNKLQKSMYLISPDVIYNVKQNDLSLRSNSFKQEGILITFNKCVVSYLHFSVIPLSVCGF